MQRRVHTPPHPAATASDLPDGEVVLVVPRKHTRTGGLAPFRFCETLARILVAARRESSGGVHAETGGLAPFRFYETSRE